jgi:hypothetical protein
MALPYAKVGRGGEEDDEDDEPRPGPLRRAGKHISDAVGCLGDIVSSGTSAIFKVICYLGLCALLVVAIVLAAIALTKANGVDMVATADDLMTRVNNQFFSSSSSSPPGSSPSIRHGFASYSLSSPLQSPPLPSVSGWVDWSSIPGFLAFNTTWNGLTTAQVASMGWIIRPRDGLGGFPYYAMIKVGAGYQQVACSTTCSALSAAWINGDFLFFALFPASPPVLSQGLVYGQVY